MRSKIIDTILFVRKLTVSKLFNAAKIIVSYYISKIFRRPISWGMPVSLSIEPTTACNLRCPECPSGLRSFTRPTGNLKSDFFSHTVDQVAKTCCHLTFYFQGEPFINPHFLQMVRYAGEKGLYTMTSTNGHFLDDQTARATVLSGLNRLIISIDGLTQETYESYRKKGNLQTVLEGTQRIIEWKRKLKSRTPYVIFQFLVVSTNEHEIPQLHDLAKKLGVDEVKLKTAQLYDYSNGHPLMPRNKKYSRYIPSDDGTYRLKNEIQNQCWKMWHSAVITWDGVVVPCCFDKDAKHKMGDLKAKTFGEVWHSTQYFDFRNKILHERNSIDICTNCTEGCTIWA
ncbi:MAG: SPASM domain-containing protein [Saprospiraceae bacterium]|nr:SPASM domain-containing protein [Saprospiraceae bacterium]